MLTIVYGNMEIRVSNIIAYKLEELKEGSAKGRKAEVRRGVLQIFSLHFPYMPTLCMASNYCTTGCVVEEFC